MGQAQAWLSNNSHLCSSSLAPRGLRFIQVFLQSLVNGEKDESNPNLMRVNITKGYEVALKKYHGWLVQQFFKVSQRSCRQSSALNKGEGYFTLWFVFLPGDAVCCTVQVRFSAVALQGQGRQGGRVHGKDQEIPRQLHRHSWRHLWDVQQDECWSWLQSVTVFVE